MVQLFSKSCSLLFPLVCKLLINIFFCLLELIHAASLGVASQVLVTIAASDHAHGVFEFSPESLAVSGTEPEDGYSTVIFNVSTFFPPVVDLFCFFLKTLFYCIIKAYFMLIFFYGSGGD